MLIVMSVDEILRKINAIMLRNNGTGMTGVETSLWPGNFKVWTAAELLTPTREIYSLSELLAPEDEDFVSNAYRTLLRRVPDAADLLANVEALRHGTQSKLDILAAIRFSAGGMSQGVPVQGLRKAWLLHRWKRRRFIGPVLSWLHEVLCLGRRAQQVELNEVRGAREIHRLGRHVNQSVFEIGHRLELIDQEVSVLRNDRKALEKALADLADLAQEMSKHQKCDQEALRRLYARETRFAAEEQRQATLAPQMEALYSAFENRFHGPEELIQEWARPYLVLMRECGAGTPEAPVIDVGCGRGEWLTLLSDEGLSARGIDLSARFVADAIARGMDVIEGDAVDVLRQLPAGSVGAVTSMHLVEHLPFERVIEFIDACHHVLRPGGVLVLEAPNSENLDVAMVYFYMDSTRRNLLPPEMLRWVVEARGYPDARVMRLTEGRELSAPALLPDALPGSASINNLLAHTQVARYYAIVAHRGGDAHG